MRYIIVYSRDDQEIIFTAAHCNGKTQFNNYGDTIKPAIEKWLRYGLHEYVGPRDNPEPRMTYQEEEEFLPRLANYLRLTTGFRIVEDEL